MSTVTRWSLIAATVLFGGWMIAAGSLPAYLARSHPELALYLNPSHADALIRLAERDLAPHLRQLAQRIAEAQNTAGAQATSADTTADAPAPAPATEAAETSSAPTAEDDDGNAARSNTQSAALVPLEDIKARIERALETAPLQASAYRMLGQIAILMGDAEAADAHMRAAVTLSKREPVALDWQMRRALLARDFQTVITNADILMRTEPELVEQVAPFLIGVFEAGSDEARQQIANLLGVAPNWRLEFLRTVIDKSRSPQTPLDLLLSLRETPTPPSDFEIERGIQGLLRRDQQEMAYFSWLQFLPPEELAKAGFLYNGDFHTNDGGAPFNWRIGAGRGARVAIVSKPGDEQDRALRITFGFGRIELPRIRQLLLLAPGSYRISGTYQGRVLGPRGLRWQVGCGARGRPMLGASDMISGAAETWSRFAFDITVPASDCTMQAIELILDARSESERLVRGEVWFDDLTAERLPSAPPVQTATPAPPSGEPPRVEPPSVSDWVVQGDAQAASQSTSPSALPGQ